MKTQEDLLVLIPIKEFSLLPKILNASIGAMIGVTAVFPLDLVKTRLQNQQISADGHKMYKGMGNALVKIFKTEGYFAMYSGASINIVLATPEKAIKLTANDFFRHHLTLKEGGLPLHRQMVAGGMAGFFQALITTPMEMVKIQMQDAGRLVAAAKARQEQFHKPKLTAILSSVVNERGLFGFYKGFGVTVYRDVIFSVVYFPLFHALDDIGPRKKHNSNEAVFHWSFMSGLASGSLSALIVTPFDVIKTRLQALKKAEGEKSYAGIKDAIAVVWRLEGPKAFFKGGVCRMMVIAPLYAITQAIYYLGIAETMLDFR